MASPPVCMAMAPAGREPLVKTEASTGRARISMMAAPIMINFRWFICASLQVRT